MRIAYLTTLGVLSCLGAFSQTVESVACHQHWPWDGKVEVEFVLSSPSADPVFEVKFFGKIGEGESFPLTGLDGDGAAGIVLGSGSKRVTWDAASAFPNSKVSGVRIALAAEDVTSRAEYLILNLSDYTFSCAATTNLNTVASGSVSKTGEIWFRRIAPGAYFMGSDSGDWGYFDPSFNSKNTEPSHEVRITRSHYIGIFEMTEAQFEKADSETAVASCLPQTRVTYARLRGTDFGATWPVYTDRRVDADSFLGRLRAKVGNSVIIDLPTEGQWELASRSVGDGTFLGLGCWNDGSPYDSADGTTDANLDKVAWYKGNSGSVPHEVGEKKPNLIGLYDMHGGVWEWCVDWFDRNYGLTGAQRSGLTIDPVGAVPDGTIKNSRRCGSYNNDPVDCRIPRRTAESAVTTYADYGFRLALIYP